MKTWRNTFGNVAPRVLSLAVGMGTAVLAPGISLHAADRPDSARIRHVLHISLDGLGSVFLKDYLQSSPNEFPGFARLLAEGAWTLNARCDSDNSVTQPNHASMLTGRPALEQPDGFELPAPHGVNVDYDPGDPWTLHNFAQPESPYKASTFDVVHDQGLSTAFFSGKGKFAFFVRSYDAEHGMTSGLGPGYGRNKIDRAELIDWLSPANVRFSDSNVVNSAISELLNSAPAYMFLHLADPDITGHYFLWGSVEYREAVKGVDSHLARLMATIDTSPRLHRQTAIVLTSDHGGGDIAGWHIDFTDPKVYTIPLCLWGAGIPRGVDLYRLFVDRFDPETRRPSYSDREQPLRNGDSGNIAMALLGLPPIAGSFMRPTFKPWLSAQADGNFLTLSWPESEQTWELQSTTSVESPSWHAVSAKTTFAQGWNTCNLPVAALNGSSYFRLSPRSVP